MAEHGDLLLEIGTEELPPTALRRMSEDLGRELSARLQSKGLEHQAPQVFATPRRLSVIISDVATASEDRDIERRGPGNRTPVLGLPIEIALAEVTLAAHHSRHDDEKKAS